MLVAPCPLIDSCPLASPPSHFQIRLMEELTQRIEAIVERLVTIRAKGADGSDGSDAEASADVLERFLAVRQVKARFELATNLLRSDSKCFELPRWPLIASRRRVAGAQVAPLLGDQPQGPDQAHRVVERRDERRSER